MYWIMKGAGVKRDRSQDYEYTDWLQVERLAGEFAQLLKPTP